MIFHINKNKIFEILCGQINNLFSLSTLEKKILSKAFQKSLNRSEFCFSKSKIKYYKKNQKTFFNPFHSGQYCIFLYYLSNSIIKIKKNNSKSYKTLADKVYYLNKTLNGIDLFYEVKMPKVFVLDHPVGTVIGKANIRDYFSFSANCTVGGNKGVYPKIGRNVYMSIGSTILGDCKIGDNVIFSANSFIIDKDVPSNTMVFGQSPNNIIKKIPSKKIFKILKVDR